MFSDKSRFSEYQERTTLIELANGNNLNSAAAFEAQYGNDTDDESSNSNIKGLVTALISIKKKRYLAERDHLIFHNNSNASQRPVKDQLMVTLRQMGMFGNGALVGILACFFRMSEGAVILYCSRVVEAILSLESTYVYWPDPDARKKIASDISNTTGFNGCVGFIDGTLLPLNEKPSIDSQDYYSCKGSYGLATLVVCDEHKRIIYYLTGWPGCSHNTRLWENCDLNLHKERFFSTGEYLIGDSGFPSESNLVPAFKKPPHAPIP
ncbi:hypothetical protein PCASD_12665 [Puccinia coronata f. sp. avenae]|uniref:DDE Tnp4 domain-containing protein n=1 Tax=Puccinia coronata f. sp. avenae TaxID=200324 RepID=A0A2N5UAP4_9BASI|nr:hypothetical protein PCASD_12665 [Puccinia coronata f. sp. avenae]